MKRWLLPIILGLFCAFGVGLGIVWAQHSAFPTFSIPVDDSAAYVMRVFWAFAVYVVVLAQATDFSPEDWNSTLAMALVITVATWLCPEFVVLIGLFYGAQFFVRILNRCPPARPKPALTPD